MKNNNIQIPKQILEGLYRLCCGTKIDFSTKYGNKIEKEKKKSLNWLVKYGKKNNIDNRWIKVNNKIIDTFK